MFQNHMNAEDCIVYAPSQATGQEFYIQPQVIPYKAWQCLRRNSGINESRDALCKENRKGDQAKGRPIKTTSDLATCRVIGNLLVY